MKRPKLSKYRHIEAWGRIMQSYPYYIVGQQERARDENAPEDAIFRNADGTWVCFSEVENDDLRAAMLRLLKEEEER